MTGIDTVAMICSVITSGSAIRATPPAGPDVGRHALQRHHRAAPASSAIFACSAVVTSMITPPLSISARPPS
jgi:hypothetical protein